MFVEQVRVGPRFFEARRRSGIRSTSGQLGAVADGFRKEVIGVSPSVDVVEEPLVKSDAYILSEKLAVKGVPVVSPVPGIVEPLEVSAVSSPFENRLTVESIPVTQAVLSVPARPVDASVGPSKYPLKLMPATQVALERTGFRWVSGLMLRFPAWYTLPSRYDMDILDFPVGVTVDGKLGKPLGDVLLSLNGVAKAGAIRDAFAEASNVSVSSGSDGPLVSPGFRDSDYRPPAIVADQTRVPVSVGPAPRPSGLVSGAWGWIKGLLNPDEEEEVARTVESFPQVFNQARSSWTKFKGGVDRGLFTRTQRREIQEHYREFGRLWETVKPNFVIAEGTSGPVRYPGLAAKVEGFLSELQGDPLYTTGFGLVPIVVAGVLIAGVFGIGGAIWAVGYVKKQNNVSRMVDAVVAGKLPPDVLAKAVEEAQGGGFFGDIQSMLMTGAFIVAAVMVFPMIKKAVGGK